LLAAIAAGIGVALVMSQIRPTFLNQASLRAITGLPVLGAVSMNWTDLERAKRKRGLYAFGLSYLVLLSLYSGLMAMMLLKP
jgi:hypothetical protein